MRAGQGRRQLDQPQGRRGRVHPSRPGSCAAYGAAVIVMAFDEQGQADTAERKVEICARSYEAADREGRLRAGRHHFRSEHLRVATGIEEHNSYGRDFIEATRDIKARNCRTRWSAAASATCRSRSAATTSVREAMHSVFLYHAIQAGMDMGIVNAGQLAIYEDMPGTCAKPSKTSCSTGARMQPSVARCRRRVPGRRRKQKDARRRIGAGDEEECEQAPRACAGRGIDDLHRRRYRRSALWPIGPSTSSKGPLMDGHERRGRPVRRRQDVPAPGRQVRPGHEEGRRPSRAVHRGRERAASQSPTARSSWPP